MYIHVFRALQKVAPAFKHIKFVVPALVFRVQALQQNRSRSRSCVFFSFLVLLLFFIIYFVLNKCCSTFKHDLPTVIPRIMSAHLARSKNITRP